MIEERNKPIWFQYSSETKWASSKYLFKDYLWRLTEIFLFKPSVKFLSKWRVFLLRVFGAKVGSNCYISNRSSFVHPWNIVIGNHVSIDDYVFIKASASVEIGDYVQIANFVKIIPGGHDIRRPDFKFLGTPIIIENGVFIGANAFIGPGVKVGQMSVIGSNTRLYKSIGENEVVIEQGTYIFRKRLDLSEYKKYRFNE